MTERKKKTGDVVAWHVMTVKNDIVHTTYSRCIARRYQNRWNNNALCARGPYRIAKVVLAK